jgi:hypothetical protein
MNRTLSNEDVEAIARRVAELLRNAPPVDADPLMDRKQAAAYLTFTVRTFDRERQRVPERLTPAEKDGPLSHRWRKSTLDMYKYGARVFVRTRKRRSS